MTDSSTAHRNLVAAMIDAVPGRSVRVAYMDDAEFHAIVNSLANLWTSLAPTLVEQANARRKEMRQQIELLAGRPWPIDEPVRD